MREINIFDEGNFNKGNMIGYDPLVPSLVKFPIDFGPINESFYQP